MKLLPEQIEDASKIASAQDLPNFSKPGTGKTFTALEAWRLTGIARGLILAPKIALAMWETEVFKTGRTVSVVRSSVGDSAAHSDCVITTYDLASRIQARLEEEFAATGGVLINDESHYVRSVDAKRTQAVFGKRADLCDGIAGVFDQVWNLSGSPMIGYANDLFTQVALLHKDAFKTYCNGTYDSFVRAFTYKKKKSYSPGMLPVWKISGNTNEGRLAKVLYTDLGIPRRLTIAGMPEVTERNLVVEVTIDMELAKTLKMAKLEDVATAIYNTDSQLNKAWRMLGLAKVAGALLYVGECAEEGPVLLGCWHRDVMQAYYDGLTKLGFKVIQVHGDTTDSAREVIRNRFNAGDLHVLIGQMGAMGVSWNLQESCKHVIIAEEYPAQDVIEQFYKRVARFGQANHVQVDYLQANCWVDDALGGVRKRKHASDLKING